MKYTHSDIVRKLATENGGHSGPCRHEDICARCQAVLLIGLPVNAKEHIKAVQKLEEKLTQKR